MLRARKCSPACKLFKKEVEHVRGTYIYDSYDEDRWPSGAAGGKVVEHNPDFKAKHVLFTPHKYGEIDLNEYYFQNPRNFTR